MTKAVEKVRTLEECEANIERCLKSFWEMGEEYRYIKDNNLYKPENGGTHPRWSDYCKERWGLEGDTVTAVIKATDVRKRLAAGNPGHGRDFLPSNERQTRPLIILPPEEQAPAWREAMEEARAAGKPQPTHEDVKRVVDRRRAPTPQPAFTRADRAHDAARNMRQYAESFVRSVQVLMDHLGYLPEDEAQGCAYKIVETVHAVIGTLEEHGYVTEDVARGVLGVSAPEDGRIEVVA